MAAEIAVDAAVAELGRRPSGRTLRWAFASAAAAVREGRRTRPGLQAMDATLTVAVALGVRRQLSRWLVGWVGDSPAWHAGGAGLILLTCPHTLEAELAGTERPGGGPGWGRNVLVRTVGSADQSGIDVASAVLRPGEGVILASDGLTERMGPPDIFEVWHATQGAEDVAAGLVRAAVEAGASDNVTVTVLRHCAS